MVSSSPLLEVGLPVGQLFLKGVRRFSMFNSLVLPLTGWWVVF